MNINKNPLFYGLISISILYVYLNYISPNSKYNTLYMLLTFIITVIISYNLINKNIEEIADLSPLIETYSKKTNITIPTSLDQVPDIFTKFVS